MSPVEDLIVDVSVPRTLDENVLDVWGSSAAEWDMIAIT